MSTSPGIPGMPSTAPAGEPGVSRAELEAEVAMLRERVATLEGQLQTAKEDAFSLGGLPTADVEDELPLPTEPELPAAPELPPITRWELREACHADAERLCADFLPHHGPGGPHGGPHGHGPGPHGGPHRFLQAPDMEPLHACMREHFDDVAADCQGALERLAAQGGEPALPTANAWPTAVDADAGVPELTEEAEDELEWDGRHGCRHHHMFGALLLVLFVAFVVRRCRRRSRRQYARMAQQQPTVLTVVAGIPVSDLQRDNCKQAAVVGSSV